MIKLNTDKPTKLWFKLNLSGIIQPIVMIDNEEGLIRTQNMVNISYEWHKMDEGEILEDDRKEGYDTDEV